MLQTSSTVPSFKFVQLVFCLSHKVKRIGNDDSFGSYNLFSGRDMVTLNKFTRHTRQKLRVLLPRRSPRLFGGVRFDVVRDLLV